MILLKSFCKFYKDGALYGTSNVANSNWTNYASSFGAYPSNVSGGMADIVDGPKINATIGFMDNDITHI